MYGKLKKDVPAEEGKAPASGYVLHCASAMDVITSLALVARET
jgi:hypothetical protein